LIKREGIKSAKIKVVSLVNHLLLSNQKRHQSARSFLGILDLMVVVLKIRKNSWPKKRLINFEENVNEKE